MRLHHLEITGFGPFADTTRIDFDPLSDAGLFLLSGPTGAGKSSVLDAVCFALYGDVPGDRSTAKRLRSDHATDDVVPRVVLEATLAGRRFRIDRSPSWTRPKKRGTGTTTEQARVVISERRPTTDGTDVWHPLSTRLDEAGHLVTRLVGMTLPQFCQVALLPQGRFQAFLRARSEDRHALLQQVFQTGRFDRVERWLRDRRVELRRTSEAHQAAVADLVSRVSEVASEAAPDDWHSDPEALRAWTARLTTAALAASAEQADRVEAASAAEVRATEASAAGIELAGLRATYAAARRAWADLEAGADEHGTRQRRAAQAQRAAAVRPLHDLAVDARTEGGELDRRSGAARGALSALLDGPGGQGCSLDDQEIAEHRRLATRTLTEIARVRPLQRETLDLERQLARVQRSREETATEQRRLDARAGELPALVASLEPGLAAAREAVVLSQALTSELEVVRARTRAARAAASLAAQLVEAEQALAEAAEARLLARETLVEIRERRLDGMAAEIAVKLAVGACCPVCGSAEHPSPASPAPGAPDDAAEREARREVDDLEVVVEAHAQQVRGLETQRATALAEAGGSVEQLLAQEADVVARLDHARTEAATVDALTARVEALDAERDTLAREREDHLSTTSRLDTEAAVLTSRIADLHRQVADVVPAGSDLDTLTSFHQRVEELA
ncbi:MAG TPA: AAA family ATPase, partial [Pedococcus sp.]